jgi:hypothetical protein
MCLLIVGCDQGRTLLSEMKEAVEVIFGFFSKPARFHFVAE